MGQIAGLAFVISALFHGATSNSSISFGVIDKPTLVVSESGFRDGSGAECLGSAEVQQRNVCKGGQPVASKQIDTSQQWPRSLPPRTLLLPANTRHPSRKYPFPLTPHLEVVERWVKYFRVYSMGSVGMKVTRSEVGAFAGGCWEG